MSDLTAHSEAADPLTENDFVAELFRAKNAPPDHDLRNRFDQVRTFMRKTMGRGDFDVFMNPETPILELREKLPEPNPMGRYVRLDHTGHGVVQMYSIVASILLRKGRLVAIEEPEAHLHAPTMGRELRKVLKDLVDSKRIHQIFVATHSNLFDLDPDGYWDVALVDGETKIKRSSLDEVDRLHLFEPGPAKHQLHEVLRLYGNEVVFRTVDGKKISSQEMLVSLQRDDDVAKAFLDTMHAAALQVTGLRARRASKPAASEP